MSQELYDFLDALIAIARESSPAAERMVAEYKAAHPLVDEVAAAQVVAKKKKIVLE